MPVDDAAAPEAPRAAHLVFQPINRELALAVASGDLAGLEPAPGWPHADTRDAMALAAAHGAADTWLVTLEGRVVGDCGVHGPVDAGRSVEIGYGLAAPVRGQGYGTEMVVAMSEWLLSRPRIRIIRAHTAVDNAPSRHALEKAGFRRTGWAGDLLVYARER
jgi:RimJ/RimL family protein N-acetyltransferase